MDKLNVRKPHRDYMEELWMTESGWSTFSQQIKFFKFEKKITKPSLSCVKFHADSKSVLKIEIAAILREIPLILCLKKMI